MEGSVSRLPFWLHQLVAEAKRRARKRRLAVLLLVLVVAGATAAVALRVSGGGSSSGGPSGRVGGTSASSHLVHFGAFVLTVPKGFHRWEALDGPKSKPTLFAFWVAHHPRAAGTVQSATGYQASEVFLSVQANGPPRLAAPRLPLDLHKLHRLPGFAHDGTAWQGIIYGANEGYQVMVFEGSKASAADRAAIEGALRSIRRAS